MQILQKVIETLRGELEQYGEILALLDRQHELVILSGAEELNQSFAALHEQSALIQRAREDRQSSQRTLALTLRQPEEATFAHLIPLLPEAYRPLVTALVQENNELLLRVRQRAQQNQVMLIRSLDLMQHFIDRLVPQEKIQSSQKADSIVALEPAPKLYEAIA